MTKTTLVAHCAYPPTEPTMVVSNLEPVNLKVRVFSIISIDYYEKKKETRAGSKESSGSTTDEQTKT